MTDSPGAPLRIYLVRHAETEWSSSGRHTGLTDIPLTERGEEEARLLGLRLQTVSFTRVLSSPRQRALRTCVLASLRPDAEATVDLAEWDYGDYEGRRRVDILADHPAWNIFHDGCPGGETPTQIGDRADRILARLETMHGNVAVCSHGHFGRVLGARFIDLSVAQAEHFTLDTASVGILTHDRIGEARTAMIARWNCPPDRA